MATKTFHGGSYNNSPGDAANWTPSGPPAPGDTLFMDAGSVMNISGGGLAGDTLTLGQNQANGAYTFNLSGAATLKTTTVQPSTTNTTINVDGRVTVSLGQAYASTANYTLNLAAGSTLLGDYHMELSGGLVMTAAAGAVFENDGTSINAGTHATINADVVGAGVFQVSLAQAQAGVLEFGQSVAATETVDITGSPYRAGRNVTLTVDRPQDFHALVNLNDGVIDLKSLGADSYSFANDMLTLYSAGATVDTLRLHNTTVGISGPAILPVSVVQQGTDVVIAAGPLTAPAGTILTLVQPPQPPLPPQPDHTPAVLIHDSTTNADVPDTISQPYSGPVDYLKTQFIELSPDNLNIKAVVPNIFVHTGAGNDAVALLSGTNVVDGGQGSNFLTAGAGTDTFFVDDRGPAADIWSTVVNFHSGDAATIFGLTPTGFAFDWENNQGAVGSTGLTLHALAAGKPTASVTLAGFSMADMASGKITTSFGADTNGSPYLYIHAT